ncbi:MAG: class I SAM-dependent methyltransferase [Alphaproteobacteria bacterium]|nr:class I SAM-dependent methyltransferase [Alphaproteobacteria bacterium]
MAKTEQDRNQDLKCSWDANAKPWTVVVRGGGIPSRAAGTDQAIVDAVGGLKPRRVVDIGCGEGWLVRRLVNDFGCDVVGIDGSAQLVADALAAHASGSYTVLTYEALIAQPDQLGGLFDVAICNFSLLGEDLSPILAAVGQSLAANGSLLIQTLHPWTGCGENEYSDGWRNETFATFETGDWAAMPWFYRTLGSWFRVIDAAGFIVADFQEPTDPQTRKPLSAIFRCILNESKQR